MEDTGIVDAFSKFKTFDLDKIGIIPGLIDSLIYVIDQTKETTMQGLFTNISKNTAELFKKIEADKKVLHGRSMLTLRSANEIFQRHLRKSLIGVSDTKIETIKKHLIDTGHEFKNMALKCRDTIKDLALDFIKNGITIMVYGYSKLVEHILLSAAEKNVRFSVIVPEVRPNCEGYEMYKALKDKIPVVTLIIDANIAYALEKADIVLVGAESVVENGGIINRAGTYMTGLCAKTLKRPLYVVTESYKFMRLFPISQKDLPEYIVSKDPFSLVKEKADKVFGDIDIREVVQTLNPLCDYTPPELITLIFTDSGIFTPSAVSDELIQIFNT